MKNILYKIALTIIVALCSITIVQAQIFPPPQQPPQQNNNVPLDPLSWTLLAAGGGVAAKRYYDKRKGINKEKDKNTKE